MKSFVSGSLGRYKSKLLHGLTARNKNPTIKAPKDRQYHEFLYSRIAPPRPSVVLGASE